MITGTLRSNTQLTTLLLWRTLAVNCYSNQRISIFHNYPFFFFLLFAPWLATTGTGEISCVYSGIAPQLPWLVTAAPIEETLSLVKPWLATAGTTRLQCAIFSAKHIFYNDNLYEWLRGSLHRQCLSWTSGLPPPIIMTNCTSSNAASHYFTRHIVAEQAELSCAGVDTWQKFQIMLDLFRNSLQTKSAICR